MEKKIESIQALRAIAAILVTIYHIFQWLPETMAPPPQSFLYDIIQVRVVGMSGVDIFFIISGFIMISISWNDFGVHGAPAAFLSRRIVRIYPTYIVYLAIFIGLFSIWGWAINKPSSFTLAKTAYSAALIPWPYEGRWLSDRFIIWPAWTLPFELYFYAIMTFCLFLKRKYFVPILIAAFSAGVVLFAPYVATYPILEILGGPLLFEFIFGICLGYAVKTGIKLPSTAAFICLIGGICLLLMSAGKVSQYGFDRCFRLGIPALMIVGGLLFLELNKATMIPKCLSKLGDSSYSLYLTHVLTMTLFNKILSVSGLKQVLPFDVQVLVIACICIFFGHIGYMVVERPLLSVLKRDIFSLKKSSQP